jgi:hypothetical protein
MAYPEQLEQLGLLQPLQPEEEVMVLPCASLELKEKLEMSRFKLLRLHLGQAILS